MKTKVVVISAVGATFKILLIGQIKAALKAGYEVHGICSDGPAIDFLEGHGIKMHTVNIKRSISPFTDLVSLWKMYMYFKKEKVQIVHTHTPKCSLLGQLAAKLAGVPIIVNTVHGFYFHEHMKPWLRRFYIAIEWIAARCSTLILSQNPEDIETAVNLGICKRSNIQLLGNGVDLDRFNPKRFDNKFKKEKRFEIGVSADAIVVGIIARLVREKGYLELFEAFKNIIAKHDNVWLVMIGAEATEKSDSISADKFKEYGIESRTLWLGGRQDIPEILSCCDIYTLPSWREGFPRSAIEAAAMGLPIVVTDIRGCRQVVDDGVNGFLVSLRDVNELETALTTLICDEELRGKMGQAGNIRAQREFDERNVCQIIVNTYHDLISEKLNLKVF